MNFTSVLTLIFITLKLTDYIDWSWWLVLSPMYITIILAFMIGVLAELYRIKKGKR